MSRSLVCLCRLGGWGVGGGGPGEYWVGGAECECCGMTYGRSLLPLCFLRDSDLDRDCDLLCFFFSFLSRDFLRVSFSTELSLFAEGAS